MNELDLVPRPRAEQQPPGTGIRGSGSSPIPGTVPPHHRSRVPAQRRAPARTRATRAWRRAPPPLRPWPWDSNPAPDPSARAHQRVGVQRLHRAVATRPNLGGESAAGRAARPDGERSGHGRRPCATTVRVWAAPLCHKVAQPNANTTEFAQCEALCAGTRGFSLEKYAGTSSVFSCDTQTGKCRPGGAGKRLPLPLCLIGCNADPKYNRPVSNRMPRLKASTEAARRFRRRRSGVCVDRVLPSLTESTGSHAGQVRGRKRGKPNVAKETNGNWTPQKEGGNLPRARGNEAARARAVSPHSFAVRVQLDFGAVRRRPVRGGQGSVRPVMPTQM
eukprot:gene15894-biopygen6711